MLTYHRTSILTSQAQTVVNTVNTVGVMGKGLAYEYRKRFPAMFEQYKKFCQSDLFPIGNLWLWKGPEQWVLNFPTKRHWRQPSKIEYIEAGLKKFVLEYERRGIYEIAFPRLGCGNGGLSWDEVKPLMERYLSALPIQIYVHDFEKDIGLPEHKEPASGHDLFSNAKLIRNPISFKEFLVSLKQLVHEYAGNFKTLKYHKSFSVSFDGDFLTICAGEKRFIIPEDELFELWVVLLKGPVSRPLLSGKVFEASYFIFAILAMLPFMRLVEIASPKLKETVAVEMLSDQKEGLLVG